MMAEVKIVPPFRLAALLVWGIVAHAGIEDFHGNWENPARDLSGLTHVVISPDGGDRVTVRAYGDCRPIACSWGQVQAKSYGADPASRAVTMVEAAFDAGFARRRIMFRPMPSGTLGFEMTTEFTDGSGRHDFAMTGILRRTSWAGPLSQNWERPPGLGSGWGGGARGGNSPRPVESCIGFDPKAARAVQQNGWWKVVAGALVLAEAGRDQQSALGAQSAVRSYRFDAKCSIAGSVYWKRGGDFPTRRLGSAECVGFNPTTVHAVPVGRGWKIVDGVKWLAEFPDDRAKADALLALIRFYRLDTECFIRRPDPVMTYWLTH